MTRSTLDRYLLLVLALAAATLGVGCDDNADSSSGEPVPPPLPPGPAVMMFTSNWGDNTILRTDEVEEFADGDTATADTLADGVTALYPGGLCLNGTTDDLYAVDDYVIRVFADAQTAPEMSAPSRTLDPGASGFSGLALDESRDRLYAVAAINGWKLVALDNATTSDGAVVPAFVVDLGTLSFASLEYDAINDRLYVSSANAGAVWSSQIRVFDNASSLTNASVPSRTITFTSGVVGDLDLDALRDRLYLAFILPTTAGNNVAVFNGAAALDGEQDPDTGSVARFPFSNVKVVRRDGYDSLYLMTDSARKVSIRADAALLAGDVSDAPRVVHGVVNKSYSIAFATR